MWWTGTRKRNFMAMLLKRDVSIKFAFSSYLCCTLVAKTASCWSKLYVSWQQKQRKATASKYSTPTSRKYVERLSAMWTAKFANIRPHFISLKKWNIWEPIYIKNKLGKSRSMWGRTYWGFLHWWLKNRRRWNATVFEAKKYGIVKTVRTFFSWFNTVKQLCISDHCGMGNLGCLRKRGFNFSLASALIYHVILLILFSCECWTRQAYPLCR